MKRMKTTGSNSTVRIVANFAVLLLLATAAAADWRDITTGLIIPDEGYSDQPYVAVLNDGSWLATLTTGPGAEGSISQHVVSSLSSDQGQSWTSLVDIEPSVTSQHSESSWVVPLHLPPLGAPNKGRVYGFYTHNGDHVDTGRSDTVGWYVFKYSDDGGQTWSNDRYRVPAPYTEIDLNNDLAGRSDAPHMKGWGVSKPFVKDGQVHIGFTKVRTGLVSGGEGWVFSSPNLLTEPDPTKITWTFAADPNDTNPNVYTTNTPPQTEATWTGLRNPSHGSIQEEHVVAPLAKAGELVMVNRTSQGFADVSYSRDDGRSWTPPAALTYEPNGSRVIKNPRANIKVWRTEAGKYLLWHHFNGTTSYNNRNPVWLSAGVEDGDGKLHWSQPEVLLYDPATSNRISYPDLVEVGGQFWVTETQKSIARVHPIDGDYLNTLFTWDTVGTVRSANKTIDVKPVGGSMAQAIGAIDSLSGASAGGFSMDFWVNLNDLDAGQTIADNRDGAGKGFVVQTTADERLEVLLNDGSTTSSWNTDLGAIMAHAGQHIGLVVDGQANIITWVVNGQLLDGGSERDFGWGRINSSLGDVNGESDLTIADSVDGTVNEFRFYDTALMTTDLVGNYRAGFAEFGGIDTLALTQQMFYDGTYTPDSATPPAGQSTWTVVTTDGLTIDHNAGTGLAIFNDSSSGRIQMSQAFTDTNLISEPERVEWEYQFTMSFTEVAGNNAVFGVRDEGGDGRFIMFAHNADGDLFYVGSDTSQMGEDLFTAIDGNALDDGELHNYRVVKFHDEGAMKVGFYLDDVLLDTRNYTDFNFDLGSDLGFGIFLSTPGLSDYVIDEVYFGPIVAPEPAWTASGGGFWNNTANWNTSSAPNGNTGVESSVLFGSAITAASTVVTDTPVTVNAITFDNANRYVVSGAGSLTLEDADDAVATIQVLQGTHEFQLPVTLGSNAEVDVVNGGDELIFNNALNLDGFTLQKVGDGLMSVNNVLILGGGSIEVNEGSLGGSGTVDGSLIVNATVTPGNSIGTLNVEGDLALVTASIYEWEVGQPGQTDTINISDGAVDLDNFILMILDADGYVANSSDKLPVFTYDPDTTTVDLTGFANDFDTTGLDETWTVGELSLIDDEDGLIYLTGLSGGTLIGAVPGDTNGDRIIDATDMANFQLAFGLGGADLTAEGFAFDPDFDDDGDADLDDFVMLRESFGNNYNLSPASPDMSQAPEPATMSLLVLGGISVLARRRRRRA